MLASVYLRPKHQAHAVTRATHQQKVETICQFNDLVVDTSQCRLIMCMQKTMLNDARQWESTSRARDCGSEGQARTASVRSPG
jgi:hypothetical protein